MAAEVRAKITMDRTSFEAGARKVAQTSGKLVKNLAKIGGAAVLGGIAATTAATYALGKGLKTVFDEGGKLSDWAARTGADAGELGILAEAIRNAGGNAESTADFINKFQKGMVDLERGLSTQADAAEMAGFALKDMVGLTTLQQIDLFGRKIREADSQTRSFIADAFGGRQGRALLPMFMDPTAISGATAEYGNMAKIMSVNAEQFDRISDILGGMAGRKKNEFFGAVGAEVSGQILEGLEVLNQQDFTELGTAVGEAISAGIKASEKSIIELINSVRNYLEDVPENGFLAPLMNKAEAKIHAMPHLMGGTDAYNAAATAREAENNALSRALLKAARDEAAMIARQQNISGAGGMEAWRRGNSWGRSGARIEELLESIDGSIDSNTAVTRAALGTGTGQ